MLEEVAVHLKGDGRISMAQSVLHFGDGRPRPRSGQKRSYGEGYERSLYEAELSPSSDRKISSVTDLDKSACRPTSGRPIPLQELGIAISIAFHHVTVYSAPACLMLLALLLFTRPLVAREAIASPDRSNLKLLRYLARFFRAPPRLTHSFN
jgi:hypothetical protein